MHSKISCLNDGFVQLIDHMGSDQSICNAARVSYGNHSQEQNHHLIQAIKHYFPDAGEIDYVSEQAPINDPVNKESEPGHIQFGWGNSFRSVSSYEDQYQLIYTKAKELKQEQQTKDRNLIRYLMRHRHTTPFEMVSFIFLVRCPIHVARQWMRHRTWSYNEYSTRYKPAIDSFETTEPDSWRKQSTNNKQGSGEYIPQGSLIGGPPTTGMDLSNVEQNFHDQIRDVYNERLEAGVAREQARKDLPLSTYTEFYAKVDLHNLFHFLSLRLDSHAQLEIRTYAEAISNLIKPIVPVSYEAFEDYRLNASYFSSQEMTLLRTFLSTLTEDKPDSLSDREWKEFKEKLNEH